MKENWTKQMKQKLEGHKMTPPAGLWEAISSEMNLEPAPAQKPVAIRRWIWAAAAVALALVGFFAFYNFNEKQPKLEAHHEANTLSHPISQDSDNQSISADKPAIIAKPKIPVKPKLLAMGTQQTSIAETNILDVIEEQREAPIEEKVAPAIEENSEHQQELKSEHQQKKNTYLPDVIEPTTTGSQSDNSSKWTIGITGSNGLLLAANDYVNSMNTQHIYNDASPADFFDSSLLNNNVQKYEFVSVYTIANVEAKHHIPLRLGLSLQYHLNNRLALVSGISYTYLKSEFSVPQHSYLDYDQELNYLGIPVGLSYKLLASEHFNIYVAGVTLIEKCVSAKVSEGDIKSRPWQWSINTSAGAEYNFTPQFGVYLEPSLGYYFNDGTSLQHYYKEHPLAPSVQFGLRLHLK